MKRNRQRYLDMDENEPTFFINTKYALLKLLFNRERNLTIGLSIIIGMIIGAAGMYFLIMS